VKLTLLQLFERKYLPHVRRTLKAKTVDEYERCIRVLILPRLGARLIATLTLDDAEELHAAVPGRVQANRAVTYLSGVLTYAVEHRILPYNPCHGVKRYPERGCEFFYTPDQTKAILAAAAAWPDIRAKYIALELLTGCRPGELRDSAPGWRHGSVLRTPDGKTGARTIYLPPAAEAILDGLAVVVTNQSETYFPADMDLRRAFVRLCRLAGVPRARLYDLRHTFASAALAAGVPLSVIGEMLGHRKAQTTKRYAHLAPDIGVRGAAAAAERMGA
jgi:integrase